MGDNQVGDINGQQNKYGEPLKFDKDFKGPVEKRGCTDVICCLLFVAYIVIWFLVAGAAFMSGDPDRLIFPTDTEGRICGRGALESRSFLFFFDLTECARAGLSVSIGCPTRQVCVKKCPAENWVYNYILGPSQDDVASVAPYCVKGTSVTTNTLKDHVSNGLCPKYLLKSSDYIGRCIPSLLEDAVMEVANGQVLQDTLAKNGTGQLLNEGSKFVSLMLSAQEVGERLLQDFRTSWWMMLVGLFLCCVFAFIWIVLMRVVAAPMVWASIILMVAIFMFGTGYSGYKYMQLKDKPESSSDNLEFTTNFAAYGELRDTWLVACIVCGVVLLVVLLMLIFLRSRIRLAIQLIVEGSKAVSSMMFTLIFPLFTYLLLVIIIAWWAAVALYIQATGKEEFGVNNITANCSCPVTGVENTKYELGSICEEKMFEKHKNASLGAWAASCCDGADCVFTRYGEETFLGFLPQWAAQVGNLFAVFWCTCFVVALGQMALAGAFASYYWAWKKPDDVPMFPLATSLYRCFRYHLGTLAFGSLIIAICKLIRALLEYVDHKTKDSRNPVATFVIKCCKCCMWCLEKFLKFLNKNAYIYCAIYGTNFCSSAKNAFSLLMRNIVRVIVLDKITDFLLFIGKLVIVGLTGATSYMIFSRKIVALIPELDPYIPHLEIFYFPTIVITVGSYIIASGFFSVYDMAVDTTFLCFLEDCERNDGSAEKPYFMSKGLMKLVSKKNEEQK